MIIYYYFAWPDIRFEKKKLSFIILNSNKLFQKGLEDIYIFKNSSRLEMKHKVILYKSITILVWRENEFSRFFFFYFIILLLFYVGVMTIFFFIFVTKICINMQNIIIRCCWYYTWMYKTILSQIRKLYKKKISIIIFCCL